MSMALDLLHQAADRATEAFPEPPFLFGLVLTNTYPQADIPRYCRKNVGTVAKKLIISVARLFIVMEAR